MTANVTTCAALPINLNLSHVIGGRFVTNKAKTFAVINPSTEEELAQCPEGTIEDVNDAVASAKEAFYHGIDGRLAWKLTGGSARKAYLLKLADLVARDHEILAKLDTVNMGAPLFLSKMFVASATDMLRFVASWADRIVGETLEPMPAMSGPGRHLIMTHKQPFGVTAGICPWNVPVMMFLTKVAQALSTGNTIVMKDSEKTPFSAAHLMTLIKEAEIPPGVVNLVHGFGNPVGEALALHMDVRKISFTGSGQTGKKVMANGARSNLKNVTLELGGKSAAIIFDDADLQKAVPAALFAGLGNSGQICAAHTRVYVQEGIFESFVGAFKAAFAKWTQGDPSDENTMGGPLVDGLQYERVKNYLAAAKTESEVLVGGDIFARPKGYFIQPTLLLPKTDKVSIVREEIFGPVVCISPFKTEEEVIARANDSEYGLSGAIYTENLSKALRLAQELETGTVGVNTGLILNIYAPFGGFKQSGIGREYGSAFIDSWTETKSVSYAL